MALREILAHFGFTIDRAGLDAAGRGVEKVKKETAGAGQALTGFVDGLRGAIAGVAAGAFVSLTGEIKEQAAALKDTSEQTGLATDELQAWTLAANLGGASAGEFVAGLRKVSKELATGVDESGQQSKLFKRLGIDTKDAEGNTRDLASVLPDIAEKFKGLTNGAEKSALAQQLFGRAGSKLVPVLSQGAAGVAALKRQLDDLGGGFSQEAIDRADDYDDALIKLNFSFFGLKSLLATQVFPWLAKTVDELTKASVGATKWVKETTGLSTAVKLLAAIIGGTLLKALAPFLLPGLKFLAIFLAVDDLIAFLDGKDSVIGALLNGWFGDGTATVVRAWANDAAEAVKGLISGGLDLLKIAVSSNSAEIAALGDHFFTVTAGIERAIDKVIAKVKGLAEALGLIPKVDGLTVEHNNKQEKRHDQEGKGFLNRAVDFLGLTGGGLRDPNSAAFKENQHNQAIQAARNAAANSEGAQSTAPARAEIPSASPVTNNISPVTVTQTFAPGTGPEVRKVAQDAAKAGVLQGLSEYRASIQNLEQRAP